MSEQLAVLQQLALYHERKYRQAWLGSTKEFHAAALLVLREQLRALDAGSDVRRTWFNWCNDFQLFHLRDGMRTVQHEWRGVGGQDDSGC